MKRFWQKAIGLISCLCMIFSAGCQEPSSTNSGIKEEEEITITPTEKAKEEIYLPSWQSDGTYDGGVHEYKYTTRKEFLVENGKTAYQLLISENADEQLMNVAKNFSKLFEQATGAALPIVTDANVAFNETAKYISIGDNQYFDSANIVVSEKLSLNGYIIKTKGDSIFIYGERHGTMFGAYAFLEYEFAYDQFTADYYYIDENVKNVYMRDYDIVDNPDIPVNAISYGFIDTETGIKQRMLARSEVFVGSTSVHSSFYYLPKETYQEEHPDWYSNKDDQLCYTANGNEEELELMIEEASNQMIPYFIENPNGYLATFSMQDTSSWCSCDTCLYNFNKYGSNAAVIVKFINRLSDRIEQWMNTGEGLLYKRDFKILFLAYNYALSAPKLLDDSVRCNEHSAVVFAPISLDFQQSLYHPINSAFLKTMDAWKEVSPNYNIYSYVSWYYGYLIPYDCFGSFQEIYRYAAARDTFWFYNCGIVEQQESGTSWTILKNYIISKLGWNVNANMDKIIETFFLRYFGDGAEDMLRWFKEYRTHSKTLLDIPADQGGLQKSTSVYGAYAEKKFWPRNLLVQWSSYVDNAMNKIAYLKKANPEKYQALALNIQTEKISLNYMLVELYGDTFAKDYTQALKLECKELCKQANIQYFAEQGRVLLTTLWTSWGI